MIKYLIIKLNNLILIQFLLFLLNLRIYRICIFYYFINLILKIKKLLKFILIL